MTPRNGLLAAFLRCFVAVFLAGYMFDDINLAFACGLSVLALLGLLRFFRRSLGFQAQTGGNFRTPLILLESLHKGDFLGETRKSSADRWSKSRSHMDGRSHDTKKQGKK